MNKTLSFVKLDLITVKPYLTWKQLLIFSFSPIVLTLYSDTGMIAGTIFMIFGMFGMLLSGYPFAVGEKNNIDTLYIILSIKRGTIVFGRYMFVLIFNLLVGLSAYVFIFVVFIIRKQDFDFKEIFVNMLIFFIVYTIIQAIQLPIFFKFTYAKAKLLVYLPFAAIPTIVFIFGNLFKDVILMEKITEVFEWFTANQIITAVIAAVTWLAAMFISYHISLAGYNKRDF